MQETLEALHRLQTIELQLAEIRRLHESKIRRTQTRKRQAKTTEELLQNTRSAILQSQKQLDEIQLTIATREESINKHRQALNSAKTNKEYAAILTALNTEKADTAKLETEALRCMEEIQAHQNETSRIEEEQDKLLEGVAAAESELEAYERQSQARREDLQNQREKFAERIEPSTLSTFLRVARHNDGEAMAKVSKIHPKRDEYICSGCNMMVTLEVVNALYLRGEVQMCKVCGRILYLEASKTERSRT